MKPRKRQQILKSFQELDSALDLTSLPTANLYSPQLPEDDVSQELEKELFQKEMDGVRPIPGKDRIGKTSKIGLSNRFKEQEEIEALKKLEDLIKEGKGFDVASTPEYIEGTGYHIHPEIARRLHRGDFSIQAHLDLHGLTAEDAKEVFGQFMKWAVTYGKTGVLVTHGRGLSSPGEPVLKKKVEEWLTRGIWRKWVVAYSSARRCDGGAGATYVLLRSRPVSKRWKKNLGKGKKILEIKE